MKILIISDSHGHVANLKHVLGFAERIGVNVVIHCGDWNTLESVEAVLSSNIPLFTVLGNADVRQEVVSRLRSGSKKFSEDFLNLTLNGKKIGITHKPSNVKKYFSDKKVDIVFCGHLHSKDESMIGNIKVVRPGATINGINFAIYDTSSDKIEFINE